MKIRTGFVSNSSSSSFVIHKSYLSKEQVQELRTLYEKLVDNDQLYDDNGLDFIEEKNYISFTAHGGDGYMELMDLLDKMKVTDSKVYKEYH